MGSRLSTILAECGGDEQEQLDSVVWTACSDDPGLCRTPASWTLKYRKDGSWVPVETTGVFGVEKDRYNEVVFGRVETDALRIEAQLREGVSAGILEWRV